MLTYTSARNLYGSLTNSDETANLSFGDSLINQSVRHFCTSNGGKWWFLEKETTQLTVANQRAYILPQSTRKIMDLYITVGTTIYPLRPIESAEEYKRLLMSQMSASDVPWGYYRQENKVLIYPTPASSGNTITIRVRKNVVDLRNADYTTGTASVPAGGTVVTGDGTTFTVGMVGRYIQFTSGDGLWYEIASFSSTTSISLLAPYEGTVVSGSNFTIGEVIALPEAYQELPVNRAAAWYWRKEGDVNRARLFEEIVESGYQMMLAEANEKHESAYMAPGSSLWWRDPNNPEPDVPTSSFV